MNILCFIISKATEILQKKIFFNNNIFIQNPTDENV